MNSIKQHPVLYKIVIIHYVLAAVCFVALSLMLFCSVDTLTGHYFQPRLLAITHVAALGWGTVIISGACYQLLPVILETELFSYKLPWISLALFIPGLVLLVCSFWRFEPGICMQTGSLLLLSGIIMFGINVFLTAGKNKKQDTVQQEFIITACIWLICTAILGVLLVFNFRYPFLPKDHLHFLKLHAHMGIAGWFLLLIIGVSSKLLPMFLVAAKPKVHLLSWAYYLINGALILFLTDTYISGISIRTFLIALIGIAGIICYLIFVQTCFSSRLRKGIDLPVLNTLISFIMLIFAIAILPLIIYFHLKNNPASVQYTTLYGTLLFMGWISALILGQTFKTLPFIVWVKYYEHLAGRVQTPMPASLFKNKLLNVQTWAFIFFLLTFFISYILNYPRLIYASLLSLTFTALLYLFNVLVILRHRIKSIEYDKLSDNRP